MHTIHINWGNVPKLGGRLLQRRYAHLIDSLVGATNPVLLELVIQIVSHYNANEKF